MFMPYSMTNVIISTSYQCGRYIITCMCICFETKLVIALFSAIVEGEAGAVVELPFEGRLGSTLPR